MKPPPFTWHAPTTVDEAVATLAQLDGHGKVLAGGQSLIPLLNMRLAAPEHLVDINRIAELDTVTVDQDGVTVGAGVRHVTLEHHAAVEQACPLLRQALRHVAHPVIRTRGTVCGSIAHADPAGELTAVLALLDGTVHSARDGHDPIVRGPDTFFVAPLEAALAADELVTSVTFPAMPRRAGSAFVEFARRHGDYALCGIGAVVTLDDDGDIATARVGAISVSPTPLAVDCTPALHGRPVTDQTALDAAGALVDDASAPEADLHAGVAYRRRLTRVLTVRALTQAAEHAARRAASATDHRDADQEPGDG